MVVSEEERRRDALPIAALATGGKLFGALEADGARYLEAAAKRALTVFQLMIFQISSTKSARLFWYFR